MPDIVINGNRYEVHQFSGEVMKANKHLETQVRGGGGGGFTYQGTGGGGSVSISSTTVTHDDVFLRDAQGREHVLRLRDWDVACREGHDMQAVWLSRDGKDTDYLMVRNRTTDTVRWAHQPFVKLLRLFEPMWLWMGLAILAVLFVMGYSTLLGLVALGLPVWLWMHQKKGRQRIAETQRELLALAQREWPQVQS